MNHFTLSQCLIKSLYPCQHSRLCKCTRDVTPIPNCHEADVNLSCWNVTHKYHAIHMCMLYDLLYTLWMDDGSLPWIMSHEPLSDYRQSHHRGLAPGYSSSSMSPVSSIHATASLKLSFHNGKSIWLLNFIKMSQMLVTNENASWRQWTNRIYDTVLISWHAMQNAQTAIVLSSPRHKNVPSPTFCFSPSSTFQSVVTIESRRKHGFIQISFMLSIIINLNGFDIHAASLHSIDSAFLLTIFPLLLCWAWCDSL